MRMKLMLSTILVFILVLSAYSQHKEMPKLESFEGAITKIYEFPTANGYTFKLALIVKSDKEEWTAFIGEKMIYDALGVKLQEKDIVKLTGFKYTTNGKSYLRATELIKGDKTVTLHQKMSKDHPRMMNPDKKKQGM